MTWFNDLKKFSLELVAELDSMADRLGDALAENDAPVVQSAATKLDTEITKLIDSHSSNPGIEKAKPEPNETL